MSKKTAATEIKKRIDDARKVDPKFSELDLSEINIGAFTPETSQLIEKVKNLEILYLSGCKLTTLEAFPKCDFLAIDISRNQLNDNSHFEVLAEFSQLAQILANQNKVEKIQTILKFESLQNLNEIDFQQNNVTSVANYRDTIFAKFTNLEVLDRKDKEGNEIPDDEEEFGQEVDEDEDDDDEEVDFDDNDMDDDDEQEDEQDESDPKKKKGAAKKK